MMKTASGANWAAVLVLAGAALVMFGPAAAHAQGAGKPATMPVPGSMDIDLLKDAGSAAIESLVSAFVVEEGGLGLKGFAILPLQRDVDEGYFTLRLQNYFSRLGRQRQYELFTRENEAMGKLLDEIGWGQDYKDIMDTATIQKFGRIAGVQSVILCRLDVSEREGGVGTVRVNMQAYQVETGRTLWGDERKSDVTARPKLWLWASAALGVVVLLWLIFLITRPRRFGV